MSLANPLAGHFQYIESFFTTWLWNTNQSKVLMVGLGGGSLQRLYATYCPSVAVDTVEIDPAVGEVAKQYFAYRTGPRQRLFLQDGRVFLRRSNGRYDAIMMDAYTKGRYGSAIPHHLATREFFELAKQRLSDDGVLAYNVIGSLAGFRADIVGSIHRTMEEVFGKVYMFPARDSLNIVMVATKASTDMDAMWLRHRIAQVRNSKLVGLPTFPQRAAAIVRTAPKSVGSCPVLTDDFAPIDGLLSSSR